MSTWTSFVKIWTVSNCEFNANFLTFLGLYHLLFALETIGVSLIIIWWQIFWEKVWREIWIWIIVILLQLYLIVVVIGLLSGRIFWQYHCRHFGHAFFRFRTGFRGRLDIRGHEASKRYWGRYSLLSLEVWSFSALSILHALEDWGH